MTTYVALIRGIMPMNPNTKSDKLKALFELLGFKNVATVIASGNVVFQTASANSAELETKIEKALTAKLNFTSTVIIRSEDELKKLVTKNPFKGIEDKKPNYLVVTFIKGKKGEIATVINLGTGNTPDFMRGIEKKHGKQITTRTWKSIARILKKMSD